MPPTALPPALPPALAPPPNLCLVLEVLVVFVYLGPLQTMLLHALYQGVHLSQGEALLATNPARERQVR